MIVTAVDYEEREHERRVCEAVAAMTNPTVADAAALSELLQ